MSTPQPSQPSPNLTQVNTSRQSGQQPPQQSHSAAETRPALVAGFRNGCIAWAVSTVACVIAALIVGGKPEIWGALLGAAFAGIFPLVTILSGVITARMNNQQSTAIILGMWLAKIVAFGVILMIGKSWTFYNHHALVLTVFVVLVPVMFCEVRGMVKTPTPYVSPSTQL